MFGRRSDGRRLDHIDPIVQFMPYVMPTRNDAMNMITEYVDYDPIADYIKKRSKEGVKVSFTALVVAAYTRAIAEYPALNRFIMNKQVFARNTINASLTVLRNAKDKNNLDEALIKMTFKPDATIDEVAEQINRLTADAVDADADNGTADFAGKIIKFRLLVQLVVALARLMDRYGILPKALYDLSPFHCSMFITNVASIGLSTIYHHLYNFGNTSIFISLGKFERKAVPSHDGVQFKTVIPLGVVTDERICGGANYAQGLMYFKKLLLHPELLETRPEHINYDYDFSDWQKKQDAKAAKKAAKLAAKAKKYFACLYNQPPRKTRRLIAYRIRIISFSNESTLSYPISSRSASREAIASEYSPSSLSFPSPRILSECICTPSSA